MLRDCSHYFHRVILLGSQIDHGFFFTFQVFASVHVLSKLVRSLHVVEHPIAARVCQDVVVIWVHGVCIWELNVKTWHACLLTRLHSSLRGDLSVSLWRLNSEHAHRVLLLMVLVWIRSQVSFQFVEFVH